MNVSRDLLGKIFNLWNFQRGKKARTRYLVASKVTGDTVHELIVRVPGLGTFKVNPITEMYFRRVHVSMQGAYIPINLILGTLRTNQVTYEGEVQYFYFTLYKRGKEYEIAIQ